MPGHHDAVNHPAHYTAGGIECIDAIEAAVASQSDPVEAFLTGQVIKYLWRFPLKNGVEDLRKARRYLDRLISRAESKTVQDALPWQDELETIIEPARADVFRREYEWAWTTVTDWMNAWELTKRYKIQSAKDITPALNRLKIEKSESNKRSGLTGKPCGKGKARLLPFLKGTVKKTATEETRVKPP